MPLPFSGCACILEAKQVPVEVCSCWVDVLASPLPLVQMVKNLSAVQETRVRSPGWEDPLEKEMAAHSSNLAWEIPWTKESGGLQSMGSQKT